MMGTTPASYSDTFLTDQATTYNYWDEIDRKPGEVIKIAVEASHYLQQLIDQPYEPLLSALGGFPLALKKHIENNLAQWKKADLSPIFVFEGISTKNRAEEELSAAKEAIKKTDEAWRLYTELKPNQAVSAFGRSGAIKAKKFVRFFQEILNEQGLEYFVAPYSACAQIAHLYNLSLQGPNTQYVDCIMGSYELFLFNVDNVITKISFEDETVSVISRTTIKEGLGVQIPDEILVDALLCTGMYGVPTFPPLLEGKTLPRNQFDLKDATLMILSSGRTVGKTCEQHLDKKNHPEWELKYQKAKMSIEHYIVIDKPGKILISKYDHLTADNHEYLGLQLPPEVLHYLSQAAINPRVLDWFSSLEILAHPPLDGGDSEEYKALLTKHLVPMRGQTIEVLASRFNRAFQHKVYTMKFWYEGSKPVNIKPADVAPKPTVLMSSWCMKEDMYKGQKGSVAAAPGTMLFALSTLTDSKFAASTIHKAKSGKSDTKPSTDEEFICNTLWRFLHVRGYIDDKHELTVWGKALLAALQRKAPAHDLEEPIFLAFELIRLDLLNTKQSYDQWIGGPLRGSEEDKADCLLISRVGCLAKLRHQLIGYTGPLSRNLLAFHSITTAVRESVRDLIEAIYVSSMLAAEFKRPSGTVHGKIALKFPFWKNVDCALGIAVKTYLDDYATPNMSEEKKDEKKKEYATTLIPHQVDFPGDLDLAFDLFASVYAGVQTLGDECSDKASWEKANKFLTVRR